MRCRRPPCTVTGRSRGPPDLLLSTVEFSSHQLVDVEAAISPASTGDGPRNMLTATAAQSSKRAGTDGASALLNHHYHHYQTTISIELCGAADAR